MPKYILLIVLLAYFFIGFLGLIDYRKYNWKAIVTIIATPFLPILMFFTL